MREISKQHHELKIAWFQDQISKLPHGYFGTWRGVPVVYVTSDPGNPKISWRSKRRHLTGTKKGREYADKIGSYIELRAQLEQLTRQWNATYVQKPRKIAFPLHKSRPDPLTREFYEHAVPNSNPMEPDKTIEYNGHLFRSKNEVIAAQVVESLGYSYKTEVEINLRNSNRLFPDNSFYVPEVDKVIVLEVDGSIESPSYVSKSYRSTAKMVISGMVEGKDFVVIRLKDGYDIDPVQIRHMILSAIDAAAGDIIIN